MFKWIQQFHSEIDTENNMVRLMARMMPLLLTITTLMWIIFFLSLIFKESAVFAAQPQSTINAIRITPWLALICVFMFYLVAGGVNHAEAKKARIIPAAIEMLWTLLTIAVFVTLAVLFNQNQ